MLLVFLSPVNISILTARRNLLTVYLHSSHNLTALIFLFMLSPILYKLIMQELTGIQIILIRGNGKLWNMNPSLIITPSYDLYFSSVCVCGGGVQDTSHTSKFVA